MIWIIFTLLCVTSAFDFFHQQAGGDINGQLSLNGFSQIMQVYTGSPPVPRSCLIHAADSRIVINYEPTINGWNTAAYYDTILNTWMEYFAIGAFTGQLPVIYDYNYVYAFNSPGISCIIGLGRANPIYFTSPRLHLTPTDIFFNEASDSANVITCENYDTAMCSFLSTIQVNGSVIGYSPVQLGNIYPYTALPTDIYNTLAIPYYTDGYWNDFSICNDSCIEIPRSTYIIKKHSYVQKTVLPTVLNLTAIGTTSFRTLDISINALNSSITIKQRAFALTNSFMIFIFWFILSLALLFLMLSPTAVSAKTLHYDKMFPTVRLLVELLVLITPSFVYLVPEYYNNFVLEFEWFSYFFLAFQIGVSVLGVISIFTSDVFEFMRPIHCFFPVISCVFFNLLLSLYNFVEGNPSIIHFIYALISNNFFFAVSFCFIFNTSRTHRSLMLLLGLAFLVVAAAWTMFSCTYFIIPTIQKVMETSIDTMYVQWPIITLFCARVGMFHAKAANVRHFMERVEKRLKKLKIL